MCQAVSNNTLKTQGYNLEHNFGHGQQYLSSFLASLNILSLLFHTVLELRIGEVQAAANTLANPKNLF